MTTAANGRPPLVDASAIGMLRVPPRPRPRAGVLLAWAIMLGLLVASAWSTYALRINVASLIDSLDNARRFVARMVPLDFPPWAEVAPMLWETMSIVLLATALCMALAVPPVSYTHLDVYKRQPATSSHRPASRAPAWTPART